MDIYICGKNIKACMGMIKTKIRLVVASKYGQRMDLGRGIE